MTVIIRVLTSTFNPFCLGRADMTSLYCPYGQQGWKEKEEKRNAVMTERKLTNIYSPQYMVGGKKGLRRSETKAVYGEGEQ